MKNASILVTILTALWAAGAQSPAAETPAKPNIILFLVDDMGWMDSTPYGSQYYETPQMDRLAENAMRFTNAYALPLCSPTQLTDSTAIGWWSSVTLPSELATRMWEVSSFR